MMGDDSAVIGKTESTDVTDEHRYVFYLCSSVTSVDNKWRVSDEQAQWCTNG